jgi:hypothetical protein
MAFAGGVMQGRPIRAVDRSARFYQQICKGEVIGIRGQHQGGLVGRIGGVDLNPRLF